MTKKKTNIPQFSHIIWAQEQAKKTGKPVIKLDKFGIARDQYDNNYYKPHGSSEYQIDNNKGGYWSHVASTNSGWNETPFKEREFENLKGEHGVLPMLGSAINAPAYSVNALLSGNYEPASLSRRRYSDSNFNPNSGKGIGLDLVTDPALVKAFAEKFGIKLLPYAQQAAKFAKEKAILATKYAYKYGKVLSDKALNTALTYVPKALEAGAKLVELGAAWKTAAGKFQDKDFEEESDNVNSPSTNRNTTNTTNTVNVNTSNRNTVNTSNRNRNVDISNNLSNRSRIINDYINSDQPNDNIKLTVNRGDKGSVVDLLKTYDIDSSFNNRAKLANDFGIVDYTGTASQNIQLKRNLEGKKELGGNINNINDMRIKSYSQLMAEGGIPMQQSAPEQGGDQMEQVMQQVAQMLQQGADPQQVMQQLVEMGVPQEQAQQMIQMVMQQMQGGQEQQGQQMQETPMMRLGGHYSKKISPYQF